MAIFEINNLTFLKMQSLVQGEKTINLGPKMSYVGIFGWNLKMILSYLKSAPSILSRINFNQCNKFQLRVFIVGSNFSEHPGTYLLNKICPFLKSKSKIGLNG